MKLVQALVRTIALAAVTLVAVPAYAAEGGASANILNKMDRNVASETNTAATQTETANTPNSETPSSATRPAPISQIRNN